MANDIHTSLQGGTSSQRGLRDILMSTGVSEKMCTRLVQAQTYILRLATNLASRVAGRGSGYPELLGSPRTSPEVPQISPEVFRRLPRKFSHCGTLQQSRGSPEVSQSSPEVPRTSPEVSRTSPEVSPFSGKPDTLS